VFKVYEQPCLENDGLNALASMAFVRFDCTGLFTVAGQTKSLVRNWAYGLPRHGLKTFGHRIQRS
jgi:hypothetical protein